MKNNIFKLCMAICLSVCFILPSGLAVSAAGGVAIAASAPTAERGGTVEVGISLSGNPGIWAMRFNVGYDHSALTLKSTTVGSVFTEGEITAPPTLNQERYIFIADRSGLTNTTENGNLITLVFEVKGDAKQKDYPITIEINEVINADGNDVASSRQNGKISVVNCMHASSRWETVNGATCTADGSEKQVCGKCAQELNTRPLKATGHNFTKKVVTDKAIRSNATTAAKATYYYTCVGCGAIDNKLYFENGTALPNALGKPGQEETEKPGSQAGGDTTVLPGDETTTALIEQETTSSDYQETTRSAAEAESKNVLPVEGDNTALIIGLIVAGIVVLVIGGGLFYYKKFYKRGE